MIHTHPFAEDWLALQGIHIPPEPAKVSHFLNFDVTLYDYHDPRPLTEVVEDQIMVLLERFKPGMDTRLQVVTTYADGSSYTRTLTHLFFNMPRYDLVHRAVTLCDDREREIAGIQLILHDMEERQCPT